MRYISTRGSAPTLGFDEVLLAGLARDGGLYLPEAWPRLSGPKIAALAGLSYGEIAERIVRPFLAGSLIESRLGVLIAETYRGFNHAAVAPLVQLEGNAWLLELFHGPTLAFKDYALQLVGRLFDELLKVKGARITVIGATSGDTGSAAIEACRDRERIEIFVLHPLGRVSEVQRRQMTTVESANVHNIAIEGSFDDCQDLVKALFADEALRDELKLAAVNSINWARIMAQIVYYFVAAVALGAPGRSIVFSVPSGNFGNVFASYAARRMGLPIEGLIVASNRNDFLTRFLAGGELAIGEVVPSYSPSMDIQISSNLERLLFDLYDGDGAALAAAMKQFRRDGRLAVGSRFQHEALDVFSGFSLDDPDTLAEISRLRRTTGELVDPHTAIGVAALRAAKLDPALPRVALATAHPAKFPDAVEAATGVRPALPAQLADLLARPERMVVLPADRAAVSQEIRRLSNMKGAA